MFLLGLLNIPAVLCVMGKQLLMWDEAGKEVLDFYMKFYMKPEGNGTHSD